MNEDVTIWIKRLAADDERAAEAIWKQYFAQLTRIAQQRLPVRREIDEEDIVLTALDEFVRGVKAGKFPKLNGRRDVWRLLVTLTVREARAQRRRLTAQKRGVGKVRGESVFRKMDRSHGVAGIDQVSAGGATAASEAVAKETVGQMLDHPGDETLKRIANLKMEGHKNNEIARILNCVERTVERKLKRIRSIWSQVERSNRPAADR